MQEPGAALLLLLCPQACGPTVHQNCKENTYVNGLCYLFGSNLQRPPQQFPEALRGRCLLAETWQWEAGLRWWVLMGGSEYRESLGDPGSLGEKLR